jgi:hypothetical protein
VAETVEAPLQRRGGELLGRRNGARAWVENHQPRARERVAVDTKIAVHFREQYSLPLEISAPDQREYPAGPEVRLTPPPPLREEPYAALKSVSAFLSPPQSTGTGASAADSMS